MIAFDIDTICIILIFRPLVYLVLAFSLLWGASDAEVCTVDGRSSKCHACMGMLKMYGSCGYRSVSASPCCEPK